MAKKAKKEQKERLFEEKLVPSKKGSGELFDVSYGDDDGQPVECLGMTFENDTARREYFIEKLREKLQDPEFRKIEGFPIGEDEDILALSDPPFYTACPNPFLESFVEEHKTDDEQDDDECEPFAFDVSEGKNDPIYNAHSYHTKVPHKAIMRYILHYTKPGDLVLDPFCGTGMTGVAAQLCGAPDSEFRSDVESDWKGNGLPKPQWGIRNAVLIDLSPAASFIAHNYNTPVDRVALKATSKRVLGELADRLAWLFETNGSKAKAAYPITYCVWSDVFLCPECGGELVFWDVAVDQAAQKVRKELTCTHCNAQLTKSSLERSVETVVDTVSGEPLQRAKQRPVLIEYLDGRKRIQKHPDESDFELFRRIEDEGIEAAFPNVRIDRDIDLWYERDYRSLGIYNVAHFFTTRTLRLLAEYREMVRSVEDARIRQALMWVLTSVTEGSSRLNRERPGGMPSKLSGTLYVGALIREIDPIAFMERKCKRFDKLKTGASGAAVVSTQSASSLASIPDNSIDYIFTDPPFGSNIIYSDLSILWESWLNVFTNTDQEAVIHRRMKNSPHRLEDYFELMLAAFTEMQRVLKPGHWITVEFHNTKNSVWNAIQEALQRAGFVIADVRILDKKQGSFKQITATGAVKQDLVISAYKPTTELEENFRLESGTEQGVWDFVRCHMRQLPVFVGRNGKAETTVERQKYLLFDRMVAFHVERQVGVPMSASEFYAGLTERFPERDEMYFLPEQAAEYDKKRVTVDEVVQLELFVSNEVTAILWVKQQLSKKPQTFQELQPQFMKEVSGWEKHEKSLELSELLDQNFLCYDGKGDVPSQVHSYLSSNFHELRNLEKDDKKLMEKAKGRWYVPDPRKEADLERIRHRALMKEFEEYRESKGKLKVVRTEAMRAGFKQCWQDGDYQTIVNMAKRVKDEIIQEDAALLMYYDNASMRTGD